jgi:hypothetical protein
MADETVAQPTVQAAPVAHPATPVTAAVAQPVTLKASAIEPLKQVKDENASDFPYHNKATEKIAVDRAKEVKTDKPYEYKANGYTVTEKDAVVAEGAAPAKTYVVTADGFEHGFADKRSAEIYVTTHAPFIKS